MWAAIAIKVIITRIVKPSPTGKHHSNLVISVIQHLEKLESKYKLVFKLSAVWHNIAFAMVEFTMSMDNILKANCDI